MTKIQFSRNEQKSTLGYLAKTAYIHIHPWLVLTCHLIALSLFSIFAFIRNPGMLMVGNDGPMAISIADVQQSFYGITTTLHSNMLEGLGNITLPWNLSVLPGFWLSNFTQVSSLDIALLYTWFALVLFVSSLLIGWNHRFSPQINYSAAWLLTLLFFPYLESFRIYSITASAPYFVCMILVFAIMDIGIQKMGSVNWLKTIFYGSIFLLGITMGLIICPASMLLIAPALMITTIYSFINANNHNESKRKLAMLLFILLFTIIIGWVQFFIGLILNTAASFFSDQMVGVTHDLIYSSILFQRQLPEMGMGIWLFCCASLGCLVAIKYSPMYRSLAIAILLGQCLIVGGGAIAMSLPKPWGGPAPVYCEIILFPFYALFSVYFLFTLIKRVPFFTYIPHWTVAASPFVIVAIFSSYLFIMPAKDGRTDSYRLIPVSTPITDILEKEIAIHEHSDFSGRVVNILPEKNWIEQVNYFSSMNRDFGNDHQTTGLWLKRIPTLHEYNQLITPSFYSLYRGLLSESSDPPYRSWSNFNRMNIKILKLLGVRYILTTMPNIKGVENVMQLNHKNNPLPLYLFKLKDINTSGIYAARILNTNNIHEAVDLMGDSKFNLRDAVLIQLPRYKEINMVPVLNSKLSFEKGGFHLRAKSNGYTFLILPIEFSHCFSTIALTGTMPDIVRVDVALTGIIFKKYVDIKVDVRTGPFSNPRCRWKDYREFSQLWNGYQFSHK
jgi:hypothetical protein